MTGAVIVFHDVREARALALRVTHTAEHDFLTGLPNRMLLNDRVGQEIVMALRPHEESRNCCSWISMASSISTISLGHPVGDKLLQSVANRLVKCVCPDRHREPPGR